MKKSREQKSMKLEQHREARMGPHKYNQLIFDRSSKALQCKKNHLFLNNAGQLNIHKPNNKTHLSLTLYTKISSK